MSEIVSELEECSAAGAHLGKNYMDIILMYDGFKNSAYPPGCFYWSGDNFLYLNSASLLQKILQKTFKKDNDTKDIHSLTGGICKRGMSDNLCLYDTNKNNNCIRK